jgi:hypothetical protein
MRKIYFFVLFVLTYFSIIPKIAKTQDCSLLNATFKTYESRCAATGSIKIFPTGGSGSYKYKSIGPVNSNFTTSDSLTGLSAGIYSVLITDIVSNCSYTQTNLIVPGAYHDPRFALNKIDVSCDGGDNGSIKATGQQFGRSPFLFSIVAPSPMGIGTVSSTGTFDNLSAGNYTIRLTDSCGGIQTRQVTINNYTWWIDSYLFNKTSCDSATGYIKVVDSKGNISTMGGIPGFMYGIVKQTGDTIWSSNPGFQFDLAGNTIFTIIAKDSCGKIKKAPVELIIVPAISAVVISSTQCNSFTATVTGAKNFFTARFCLFDSANALVSCNTTGVFTNLPYGNYCIQIHDICTDTTIVRCFTASPPPLSINSAVLISNKTCALFSAAIGGQNGLTNPAYCLYDSANVLIKCNTTGVFTSLTYGLYCIKVTDGCRDTTITTCFSATRPVPNVPTIITPHYVTCNSFGISIGGDSLTNPRYCLYDSTNVLIGCNNTGIFDSLAVGSYCANVYDSCFDTTFIRCFTAGPPVIANDIVLKVTNKICLSFTLTATSNNIKDALFCLYNAGDSLITCDSSGIFNSVPYGSYCVKAKNNCPDTSFTRCVTVPRDIPSVNTSVKIINNTCNSFSAQIYGQQHLSNPGYCLYDSAGVQILCNDTGKFDSLLYGQYCIKITDSCYDTTIVRCFTARALPAKISVTSYKSCSYNFAKFSVSVNTGVLPVNIKIYDFNNSLFFTGNYNSNNFTIDSIAGTITGQTYKIIATDNCGKQDSVSIGATASYLKHGVTAISKCPSGNYTNGSGDIQSTATTNMGSLTVRIIKDDNISLSPQLSPNTAIGGVYTFQDIGPGTYILNYKASDGCNIFYQDTVVIQPYHFPDLGKSSAYQCDSNGFNLKAIVSNGVGPFSFEIIGSSPAAPSIIAAPQASPDFAINNGTNYTLVRLRALDACGNATLADASVLPLANNAIVNTYNCYQAATTLRMDTVYNANFAWYKKAQSNSTDSLYLSSASSIYIPFVTYADTGIYICHFVLGTGCINRTYNYHLDGSCYHVLPINLQHFSGNFVAQHILLSWQLAIIPPAKYVEIEKSTGDGNFKEIGSVKINAATQMEQYLFTDTRPATQNFYRLKWKNNDGAFTYSNIVEVSRTTEAGGVRIYPNPADDLLNISFTNPKNHLYNITMLNLLNQPLRELKNLSDLNVIQISSSGQIKRGIYIIKLTDLNTQEIFTQKVIFR